MGRDGLKGCAFHPCPQTTDSPIIPSKEACEAIGECYDVLNDVCSLYAPCPRRQYCVAEESSPFYLECAAYPDAECQFTGCGGCTEYFTDALGSVITDCGADLCTLQADVGTCKASFRRWYFDKTDGRCKRFVYGGCGGNANNFTSKRACRATCVRQMP